MRWRRLRSRRRETSTSSCWTTSIFGETGTQASHTGRGIALHKVAEAAGFAETAELRSLAEVDEPADRLGEPATGPRLFVLKIKAENLPRSLPPRDVVFVKNRFRAHLGLGAC